METEKVRISTSLNVRATAAVDESAKSEITIPDPAPEAARAAIDKHTKQQD